MSCSDTQSLAGIVTAIVGIAVIAVSELWGRLRWFYPRPERVDKKMITVYNTQRKLPKEGQYVVCRYNGGNWHDADDQKGCIWKVAKFEACSVGGNDILPYHWREFGPLKMFGHEVDLWFNLPRP